MKLKDCEIGKVVQTKDKCWFGKKRIGHIVGLELNYSRELQCDKHAEVVPSVLWAGDKHPVPVHYNNIELCNQ